MTLGKGHLGPHRRPLSLPSQHLSQDNRLESPLPQADTDLASLTLPPGRRANPSGSCGGQSPQEEASCPPDRRAVPQSQPRLTQPQPSPAMPLPGPDHETDPILWPQPTEEPAPSTPLAGTVPAPIQPYMEARAWARAQTQPEAWQTIPTSPFTLAPQGRQSHTPLRLGSPGHGEIPVHVHHPYPISGSLFPLLLVLYQPHHCKTWHTPCCGQQAWP